MDSSLAKLLPLWLRRMLFFLALTCGLGGLQGIFTVQMAMGSPYLISLGFSKPLIAIVWIAGPLAGVIGQPYFGICSDQCRVRWGKRKPFIAAGATVVICSLLALAWTKDTEYLMSWAAGANQSRNELRRGVLVLVAVFIWVLNFAIQPLQGGLRALIVDSCAPDEIDTAFAWASRMVSIGNLIGYATGFVDFASFLKPSVNLQFKALSALAACGLAATVCICCLWIRERDPNEDGPPNSKLSSTTGKFQHIYRSLSRMPPQVKMVCKVQFCSWVGWFSFLYYITTYITELYLRDAYFTEYALKKDQPGAIQAAAARQASLALLIFAIVQLSTSVLTPLLIPTSQWDLSLPSHTPRIWKCLSEKLFDSPFSLLCSLWIFSHALFAVCMFSTFFVTSVSGATVLVGVVGICAALSQFVPFTLIGLILSRYRTVDISHPGGVVMSEKVHRYETQPGLVMGVHNMAIAAPQLLAAFGSSMIFFLMGTDSTSNGFGGDSDMNSTAWVLRAGGITALLAVYMTTKVHEHVADDSGYIFPDHDSAGGESLTLLQEIRMSMDVSMGMDL